MLGSVLRAPSLRAPSFGAVGLFLLAYLVLLVPVNYAVLKRLNRREWTWLTVPLLVAVFSVGAYGFGYAMKGGQIRLNTASLVEMGPGTGDSTITTSVGIFSPRRATYDVSLSDTDAMLFAPESSRRRTNDTPLVTAQDNGAAVRGADISMWAMRVFGARTTARLGDGLQIRLARRDGSLSGWVKNRTGRVLQDVSVSVAGQSQRLAELRPGERKEVRLPLPAVVDRADHDNEWERNLGAVAWGAEPGATRSAIRASVHSAVSNAMRSGEGRRGRPRLPNGPLQAAAAEKSPRALITAWNYDPLLPLRVDGRTVATGDHVSLLLVQVPIESVPSR